MINQDEHGNLFGKWQIGENTGGLGFPTDASVGPFADCGTLERAVYGLASIVYVKPNDKE